MATQYAPLFALETQFQTKDGRNNTGGWLKVFLAATDDPATTYSDYNGTRNPEKIVLDDDGRALVICDKSKAYRLEVYDINGMLLWTEEPVYCSGTGGGGVSITRVISTDGSISVEENVAGSTTTYDIGLAPNDSDEFLEWIKCSEEDCGSTWYPVFQDGTMETESGQGIKVHGGHLYHFTNSFTVDPDGTGINYDTFRVTMYCGDDVVDERDFDIDSSLSDPVLCEFSRDVVPTEDTNVYFKLTIPSTCEVSGEVQCHRIYSGVNAVPDTCATKQFVSANYQPLSGMSAYVPYSAVGGNVDGQVTGINGSSIAATVDTASLTSSFVSNTAFTSYSSTVENILINMENNVSDISSTVSGLTGTYLEQSASALFAPSGDYAYNSSVSSKVDQSAFDNCCSAMSSTVSGLETSVTAISSNVSGLTGVYLEQSASSLFQPSGDYAYNSSLSAKLDTSAFSVVSGNFVQNSAFTSYTASALTAIDNSISSIQSSMSSMSSDVSGKVDKSAMSAWIPYSALDYSGSAISGIGGSSLAGMGGGGGADYTGIYPVDVNNTSREIAVDSLPLVTDSSMTSYASGDSSVIGVNLDIMSGKLDKTAQVVTATATQLYAGTAYLTSVNGAPVSASRAGNAANASLANSAYYDGTGRLISSLPDSATVSAIASAYTTGKQDKLTFGYDASNNISSIDGSALAGGGGGGGMITSIETSLNPWYQESISGLNGLSLYPKWAVSAASAGSAGTATYATNAQSAGAAPTAWASSFITGVSSPSGTIRVLGGTAVETTNSAVLPSTVIDGFLVVGVGEGTTNTTSFTVPESNPTTRVHFGSAYAYGTFTIDTDNSIHRESSLDGGPMDVWFDLPYATSFTATYPWAADVGYTASASAYEEGGGVRELAWASALPSYSYDGSGNISAINGSAIGGQGGIDSATCSAIASSYAESAASSKQDSSAMSAYVPFSAISADENSAITSINGSSIGGGAQVVTATGSANFNGTGINTINGSSIIAKSLSAGSILIGSSDPGLYLTGGSNGGTAYYKSNELVINRSGYGETIKFNLGSAGSQIYGSAAGTRGAFIQMSNDNHTAFFGAASGADAKIELDGYSAGSANMAGWDSSWNTVSSNSSTWGAVTSKMDSTAVQSAYASASATQATAQGVLYILIPDGV